MKRSPKRKPVSRALQARHAPPCPSCGNRASEVRRTTSKGDAVQRVRHCKKCPRQWTTKEIATGITLPATGIETLLRAFGITPAELKRPITLELGEQRNDTR